MYMLNDYALRTQSALVGADLTSMLAAAVALPEGLRLLDFGCGVGRLMEALVASGFSVDGTDVSEEMLAFARANPKLSKCSFYLSGGGDCGDSPRGHYDIVYSQLCIQHIASRQIRKEIFSSVHDALKPGGMFSFQLHFYPGLDSKEVPLPHVSWDSDKFDALGTNSEEDVWFTADALPSLMADLSGLFQDVRIQIVDFPANAELHTEAYGVRFSHAIISGSKGFSLAQRVYAEMREDS
ncbi:MAG: class I SAM-dependent methyltransferase [Gammaproteobacteria bacterium]|nr:class I SAM-dependent methyltransferase [Gammaproteobacteria bacterium]